MIFLKDIPIFCNAWTRLWIWDLTWNSKTPWIRPSCSVNELLRTSRWAALRRLPRIWLFLAIFLDWLSKVPCIHWSSRHKVAAFKSNINITFFWVYFTVITSKYFLKNLHFLFSNDFYLNKKKSITRTSPGLLASCTVLSFLSSRYISCIGKNLVPFKEIYGPTASSFFTISKFFFSLKSMSP